jgi:tRNA 2-selenouridine synthase
MVGLVPCTPKAFDSRLFERLSAGFPGPAVFEGESRKVGDVILPPVIWNAMQSAPNVHLTCSVERRAEVLIEDYLASEENRGPLREQLPFIEDRLGGAKWSGRLVELLDARRERELVALLLEHYYDPLYRHSEKGREYAFSVDTANPSGAAERIVEWIEKSRSDVAQ